MAPENNSLTCELCNSPMTVQRSASSPMVYFYCAGCNRWVASNYGEDLLKTGTAASGHRAASAAHDADFARVKNRLTRWLAFLEESDPYQVLGLPPSAPEETVRARFRELALANHPDRGGDPAQMRRVLAAYDRIRRAKPATLARPSSKTAPVVARAARRR